MKDDTFFVYLNKYLLPGLIFTAFLLKIQLVWCFPQCRWINGSLYFEGL